VPGDQKISPRGSRKRGGKRKEEGTRRPQPIPGQGPTLILLLVVLNPRPVGLGERKTKNVPPVKSTGGEEGEKTRERTPSRILLPTPLRSSTTRQAKEMGKRSDVSARGRGGEKEKREKKGAKALLFFHSFTCLTGARKDGRREEKRKGGKDPGPLYTPPFRRGGKKRGGLNPDGKEKKRTGKPFLPYTSLFT